MDHQAAMVLLICWAVLGVGVLAVVAVAKLPVRWGRPGVSVGAPMSWMSQMLFAAAGWSGVGLMFTALADMPELAVLFARGFVGGCLLCAPCAVYDYLQERRRQRDQDESSS